MKVIRLTGAETYASERTYGFSLKRSQTIKLRDEDAARILLSTQSGVALFTATTLNTADFDASTRYNGDDPVVYDERTKQFLAGADRKLAVPAASAQATGGIRTVLIGHSYLDQETGTFSYNRPIYYLNGTVSWMNFFLGWPLEVVKSHAIGGERLIDIKARLGAALDEPADLAIWNAGINDLKETKNAGNSRYSGLPYPVDPKQRNLAYCIEMATTILKSIADRYGRVIILPETSPANGAGDQNKHLAARTSQYNHALYRLAATDHRMIYVPLDRVTYDPLSSAGNVRVDPVSGSSYYADSIHPGNAASYWRGKYAADYVRSYFRKAERLPDNVFETYSNLKIVGTSISSVGNSVVRILCPNALNGFTLIREGDKVSVGVPTAGQEAWNGRWLCVAATSTYVEVSHPGLGAFTGTVNLCTATQLFDNPLFATQTGGASSGGGVVAGVLPSNTSLSIPAGCTATVTYSAHTGLDGVADGLGSWLDIDFALAANATVYLWLQQHRYASGSAFHARIHNGDVVQAGIDLEIVGDPVNLKSLDFGLTVAYTPPSSAQVSIPVLTLYRESTNTSPHPNRAGRGVLMTGEWRVPATGTLDTMDGQLTLVAGASACTVRLRLGRAGIFATRYPLRDVDTALDI